MSQQQTVEAARVRIQRLVDEISALSKGEMRSEEYYQQFLTRAVAACDGRGGGVWLVGQRTADGKSEFQLAAAVDLESSLFQTDEAQRGLLLRALAEVVNTKKPTILPADSPTPAAAPGSLQAQLGQRNEPASPNRAPYPFIQVPLFLKEQVLGVLQVWLQPYVARENYAEFANFLTQLATHVEQYFQSRRLGNLVVENQRLQHLLKFSTDLSGSLDPQEVARLDAGYSRDLLACERTAVLQLRGDQWEILAISGQEVVEKKSSTVKSVAAFVGAHTPRLPHPVTAEGANAPELKPYIIPLNRKELLSLAAGPVRSNALAPNGNTRIADNAYFEMSQVASVLIVQLLDSEKRVQGALLAESTNEGFFDLPTGSTEPPPSHRLAEWLAGNTGRALAASLDHRELPFLFATKRLRDARRQLAGSERKRYILKRGILLGVLSCICLFPWKEEVESDCTLIPQKRVKIVPEVAGRVEKVIVREGRFVKQGDPIAKLDTAALEADLKHGREEVLAATAESEKYRGLNDPSNEQIALTKVRAAEEHVKSRERDIASANLKAPMDGVILTKDIELIEGVFLNAGADFAIIGSKDAWDLQVHVNEKKIGKIESALARKKQIEISFILYSQNMHPLGGVLLDRSQVSQVAYPPQRENAVQENAFVLTLPDVQKQAPEEVRRGFRPELTGRASIPLGRRPLIFLWGRAIAEWFRLKWVW